MRTLLGLCPSPLCLFCVSSSIGGAETFVLLSKSTAFSLSYLDSLSVSLFYWGLQPSLILCFLWFRLCRCKRPCSSFTWGLNATNRICLPQESHCWPQAQREAGPGQQCPPPGACYSYGVCSTKGLSTTGYQRPFLSVSHLWATSLVNTISTILIHRHSFNL